VIHITGRPKLAAPSLQNRAYYQQKNTYFRRIALISATIAAVSSHPQRTSRAKTATPLTPIPVPCSLGPLVLVPWPADSPPKKYSFQTLPVISRISS
jgi:hypothetical protein